MKPFDLEKAKAGHPLVTRDGRSVKFIAYLPECHADYRVVALTTGAIWPLFYQESGRLHTEDEERASDLFLTTAKKTYWFAYGPDEGIKSRYTTCLYENESDARSWTKHPHSRSGRWSVTSIEIEE